MQTIGDVGGDGVRLALHRGVVAHDLGFCRASLLRFAPEASMAVYPDGGLIAVQFHVTERAVGDFEIVPDTPSGTSLPSNMSPTRLRELPDPYGSYATIARDAIYDVYGAQLGELNWQCSHDVATDDGTVYVFSTAAQPALAPTCVPDSIRLLGDRIDWEGRDGVVVDYHQNAPLSDEPVQLSVQHSDGGASSVPVDDVEFADRGGPVLLAACQPDDHAFDGDGICTDCGLCRRALACFAGQSVASSVVACHSCDDPIPQHAGHNDVWGNPVCGDCWSDYSATWGRPVGKLYSGVAFHDPICGWFDTSPPKDRECPDCGEARLYPIPEVGPAPRYTRLE